MVMSDSEDTVTKVNTAVNKSGILTSITFNETPKPKSRRSVIIDESIRAASTPIPNAKINRKSILKKPDQSRINEHDLSELNLSKKIVQSPNVINKKSKLSSSFADVVDDSIKLNIIDQNEEIESTEIIQKLERPHNLEDFFSNEILKMEKTSASCSLNDLDENDELWIMEIPKTVDPKQLIGQVLIFGDKSSLKFDKKKYHGLYEDNNVGECMTCVFSTGETTNEYKNASILPSGTITVRRKIAISSKEPSEDME